MHYTEAKQFVKFEDNKYELTNDMILKFEQGYKFKIDKSKHPGEIDNFTLIDLDAQIFKVLKRPEDPLNYVLKPNLVKDTHFILTLKKIS